MHYGIRNDLEDLRALWPRLDLGSGARADLPERLERAITEHCERPDNRDGRGVRSGTVAEIRKALRHLKSAARRATIVGTAEARAAKKLLKSAHHARDFETLADRARGYAGLMQRLGKQRARQTAVCERTSVCLGEVGTSGDIHLERVVSVADLESIGDHLHLCVAHNDRIGREYHRRLRENATEFWQMRTRTPLALLEVARGDGEEPAQIVEYGTMSESAPRLPRSMLLRVVRELHASGDEIHQFKRVGAFWTLRERQPPTATVQVGQALYRVWRFPDELIIQGRKESRHGRRVGWSRFERDAVSSWHSRARGGRKRARGELASTNDGPGMTAGSWAWSSKCSGRRALCNQQLQALMLASREIYSLLAE